MDSKKVKKSGGFESMGLKSGVYQAIKKKGFNVPTPIQRKTIPLILGGGDVVAASKTGSGKTAAYLIPLINRLEQHSQIVGIRALIILPTRELALQIAQVLKFFIKFTDLTYSLLVGGHGFEGQFESLAQNPDILICTPGRVVQHLVEDRLKLSRVQTVIYDEADILFEMGLADQLKTILQYLPQSKQSLIFSATIPEQLSMFASVGLKDYVYVKLDQEYQFPDTMDLNFILVASELKMSALLYIINTIQDNCIVFASTRYLVDLIAYVLTKFNVPNTYIYGKMDQFDRKEQLEQFKRGESKVLVVTDLASRGIDLPFVANVIHFDYPAQPKIFIHRSGRTARAGRKGCVYALTALDEIYFIQETMIYAGRKLVSEGELDDTTKAFYGSMPIGLLMENQEQLITLDQDIEYTKLLEMAKNANQKFRKTRGSSNLKKTKSEINVHNIHPMFKTSQDDASQKYLDEIRAFKPIQSFIETKKLQENNKKDPFLKALYHLKEHQIGKNKHQPQKMELEEPKQSRDISKFVDNKYYVPTFRDVSKSSEFDELRKITTSDIHAYVIADETDGLRKQQFKWDSKSKKFVRPSMDKDDKKINPEKGKQSYNKWQKRNQMQIQKVGETEDTNMISRAKDMFSKRQMRAKGYHFDEPNRDQYQGKNEIKNSQQLLKSKKIKKNLKLKNMEKPKRTQIERRNRKK